MSEIHASPARVRRAWRAGWRGRSSWLTAGIACLLGAMVLRSWSADLGSPTATLRAALVGQGDGVLAFAAALAQAGVGVLAAMLALVLVALLLAALALGRLGPVEPELAEGLGVTLPPLRMRIGVGLGALLLAVASFELRGRIAGASRAADAGSSSLLALWHGSAVQLAMVLGTAMLAVGVLEAWWHRRDRLLALRPTVEQVRAEARERGGRRT